MSAHRPASVGGPFFTGGTFVLLAIVAIGAAFGAVRMTFGLGAVTNLTDAHPWGLWVAVDVACGVALAAGGFTTAALIDVFGQRRFHPLLRPALLTAWLGYAFVAFAVFFDIGRYWNIWRPIFHWQGNSALFEVGMCVMTYLAVLTVEMSPTVLEGVRARAGSEGAAGALLERIRRPVEALSRVVRAVLPLFIVAGVVLSLMHQSSLGTMMAIAPTKLSPLWFSPLLPLLFLMSAVMVGPAMVILESLLAARAFGRRPEMELLAPLAGYVPWMIAAYGLVRLADLLWRWPDVVGHLHARAAMAASVEILAGLVLPLLLLTQRRVRRSPSWLLVAASLVIAGVVLNRINVYIVGFEPPFAETPYVPAVGEVAVTAAIVATIVLLYRFFVVYFPVLPAMPAERAALPDRERVRWRDPEPVPTRWAWVYRAVGAAALLGFVVLYTTVHEEAIEGDIEALEWSAQAQPVPIGAGADLAEHRFRPRGYKRLYRLDNERLNRRTDFYEPVRFSHTAHDNYTRGNCGVCHHRFSYGEEDRVGEDLESFHREYLGVRVAGACANCHDMEQLTTQSCESCHRESGEPVEGNPVGLKGAYHRQCIGCHERQPATVRAPTDCVSCHHPHTPDHAVLVELEPGASPRDVTRECLRCHEEAGAEILKTAHWLWRGHSAHVAEHEASVDLGLETVMNNHCFTVGPNPAFCASCHIGHGWRGEGFDFASRENIDCLVCHDTTGTYRKPPGAGGDPAPDVDLARVARQVGRPSPGNCGACHYMSGGARNSKHGDLEALRGEASVELDVHLRRLGMRCQDCHTTRDHQIAGRSVSAPASEGRVTCAGCHGHRPHGISGALGSHLDEHVAAVSCEACHIPMIARQSATRMFVDWSKAGQDRSAERDAHGRPTYDPRRGEQRWEMNVVPVYRWYSGMRRAYVVGDTIDPSSTVELNLPLGERYDPEARIFPFKVHEAIQPFDEESHVLLVPKLAEGLWEHGDWSRALEEGAEALGLSYSGEHDWVRTRMYTGIHHEVVPAGKALGCADCHAPAAVRCGRCHDAAEQAELPEHRGAIYPESRGRMDFRALGYDGDPARLGGRFRGSLGRGAPLR